ncbi:transducin-like enhancer protein 6 [Trichechus manatus latirostris]|uniref:Transducin-like enhancer protein 6 n=1 Tax=Trichechus manatus latirostris TaxID=127582 RepID=A0A2Y9RBE7_TRIMA|nr:transducin-like enhancer protein 6 [Trichechus manatus latirostris]
MAAAAHVGIRPRDWPAPPGGRPRVPSPRAAAARSKFDLAFQMMSESLPTSQKDPHRTVKTQTSPSKGLQQLSDQDALGQLKTQSPRVLLQLSAQLENICHSLQKIQKDLQEHHKQVENLLKIMETCSQTLDSQPVTISPGDQSQKPASFEAPRQPRLQTRQPSNLQEQSFKDVAATRLSAWSQQPSQADGITTHRPQPRSFSSSQPRLWQDVLTERLFQIYAGGVHVPAEQPRHGALSLPTSSSSSPGDARERGTGLDIAADETQEPPGIVYEFSKPISWDLEDFQDDCKRPDTFPWKSKKLAVPYKLEKRRTLDHGEPVLAVAVSSFTRHAFTCGRRGVKVWGLTGQKTRDRFPVSHIPVQTPGAYLRTCLLFPDSTALLTGGSNLTGVSLWDLAASQLHVKAQLPCQGLSCQALAASPQDSLAFAGFTEGALRIWDLRDESVVRCSQGWAGGTRSIVIKDHNVWIGGVDAHLRCWDLRMVSGPREYQFESQIMSLAPSPSEDWVLLGMANGRQWLQHTSRSEGLVVADDCSAVLGLRFSPYGQWWMSVGLDDLISIYSMPLRKKLFQVPETCVRCCDVALNNRLIVAGSGDNASVYQVTY